MSVSSEPGISPEAKGRMIPITVGDITLFDAGNLNCAVEVREELLPALRTPLAIYAASILLNGAAKSTIDVNKEGSRNRNYAISPVSHFNDFVRSVDQFRTGSLKVTEDRFSGEARGLAGETVAIGLFQRLGIPYEIPSWEQDWYRGTDFTLFGGTPKAVAVGVTTSTFLDEVVDKIRRFPDVTTLAVPIRPFSETPPWLKRGEPLLGGAFDDSAQREAVVKMIGVMAKEDPLAISSNRVNLLIINAALQEIRDRIQNDLSLLDSSKMAVKALAEYNLRLMTALVRPTINPKVQLTKDLTQKTTDLSRRLIKEVSQ